ncbi:hypothetical protein LR48_Vigan07g238000 [Vigna angularis]|uniref:Uncharacterized protein n=1 Tax=Phaseolus angularis TaxID=3914 RepID=A0A0L9V152_PHAAN|nr:hypothetical protein LR48_Vigan07g238000 [Vigna angularis]
MDGSLPLSRRGAQRYGELIKKIFTSSNNSWLAHVKSEEGLERRTKEEEGRRVGHCGKGVETAEEEHSAEIDSRIHKGSLQQFILMFREYSSSRRGGMSCVGTAGGPSPDDYWTDRINLGWQLMRVPVTTSPECTNTEATQSSYSPDNEDERLEDALNEEILVEVKVKTEQ